MSIRYSAGGIFAQDLSLDLKHQIHVVFPFQVDGRLERPARPGDRVGLVMRVLEPIWNEKPETASRVRGRIESILDWAKARGYRQGENPARWRGHLENLLPKKSKVWRGERHPAPPHTHTAA